MVLDLPLPRAGGELVTGRRPPRAKPAVVVEAATVDPVDAERLRIVCAWCGAAVSGNRDVPVSHGICPACAGRFLAQLPLAYLASIADADGTVTLFSGYRFEIAREPLAVEQEQQPPPPGTP